MKPVNPTPKKQNPYRYNMHIIKYLRLHNTGYRVIRAFCGIFSQDIRNVLHTYHIVEFYSNLLNNPNNPYILYFINI